MILKEEPTFTLGDHKCFGCRSLLLTLASVNMMDGRAIPGKPVACNYGLLCLNSSATLGVEWRVDFRLLGYLQGKVHSGMLFG